MATDFAARLERFKSLTYPELFPAQAHVLARYASSYAEARDVAIELPTGVGKTLIALLIADLALDRGWSVAYLTGSNALSRQVVEQAGGLPELPVRMFSGQNYPGDALLDYHEAQAIGVMNYWVYLNSSPRVEPADLVLFDDAHLAEQPLTGLYTTRIGRLAFPELYDSICDAVLAHTDAYENLPAMRDGTLPWGAPPELLAFNDWDAIRERVADIVDRSSFTQSDERYVWREVKPKLARCAILIGPSGIEIGPYHPPSSTNPWVSEAKQRVYLSATLGSMDDLERRLGIGPIEQIAVPGELHMRSTGDRLFAINWSTDDSLTQPLSELVLELAGKHERVAWLCSSHTEADQVEGFLRKRGQVPYRLRPRDDAALENWRAATSGHLVAAGRFDGLDFAEDTCRLVVLPHVPAGSSEFERFVVAYLGDATFMRHRIGQRITQALGRANRVPTDWAIYVGLDPGFAGTLSQPAIRRSMDASVTRLVQQALDLHGQGALQTEAAIRSFWSGDRVQLEPRALSRPGRARRTDVAASATGEVAASNDLWLGDYSRAAAQARQAADALNSGGELEHAAFWRYVEAHARFASGGTTGVRGAADALRPVVENGPRTPWFIRLQRTVADLEGRAIRSSEHDDLFLQWDAWLRDAGAGVRRQISQARSMLRGTHDQRAEALLTLARMCGVWAERPTGPSATDVRWTWVDEGSAERRVWEVKTGQAAERVPRDDVNQVLGQWQIERQDHPRTRVLGCLMTTYSEMEIDAAAAAREHVVVIRDVAVQRLFELLADRVANYQRLSASGTAGERGHARSEVEQTLPAPGWLRRLLSASQGRVVGESEVTELFVRVSSAGG